MEQQQKPEQGLHRPLPDQSVGVGDLLRAYLHGGGEKPTQMLSDAEDGNQSVDLTQRSMQDAERSLRINRAQQALHKKERSLASVAALFLDDYSRGIEEMVSNETEDNPHIREHWDELQSLYESYRQKQDELLRAVSYPIAGTMDR